MYSGMMIFTKYSGRIMGAHQKIDRVARKHLSKLVQEGVFPEAKKIVYFEGSRGPDSIKVKSPAKDEPWHFFDPFDDNDTQILEHISDHYKRLVKELKADNQERIAFEAAWLSHAIVDGLTPAHHYPYEKKLGELRGGEDLESRNTYRKKLIMPGTTKRQTLKNNWGMWGSKGLYTTHMTFELGIAAIIAPLSFSDSVPKKKALEAAQKLGLNELFKRTAREIGVLDMYTRYYEKGWTPKLAYDVRHKLGPLIINNVTLAWYLALLESGKIKLEDYENHRRKFGRKNHPKPQDV
jgi:hypothetical protein